MPGERIKTMISNCITGNQVEITPGGSSFQLFQIDLEFGLLVYVKEGEP